jgi:hypothetical protein
MDDARAIAYVRGAVKNARSSEQSRARREALNIERAARGLPPRGKWRRKRERPTPGPIPGWEIVAAMKAAAEAHARGATVRMIARQMRVSRLAAVRLLVAQHIEPCRHIVTADAAKKNGNRSSNNIRRRRRPS